MNSTIKTILLTLLTLSVLTIAMIEVSGISENKLSSLFDSTSLTEARRTDDAKSATDLDPNADQKEREAKMRDMEKTVLSVKDSIHNFGKIKEGDKVRHTYTVENVGEHPLFIANVATSCGCTAPEFGKEPILPGASAQVTLEFNSAGKKGNQKKSALIISNAVNAPYSIGFEAEVE